MSEIKVVEKVLIVGWWGGHGWGPSHLPVLKPEILAQQRTPGHQGSSGHGSSIRVPPAGIFTERFSLCYMS